MGAQRRASGLGSRGSDSGAPRLVVLQLGPYPPPHGGVQTNLVAIRAHVRRLYGWDAAPVINLTRHRRANADDVYYPRSAFEVIRLLSTIPADVIHLHVGGHLSARLLGLCLVCSLIPGKRTVLTFHSGGYPGWHKNRKPGPMSLRGLVLRRLDAVIAVNAEIASLFADLGVAPWRIHTICPYAPVSVHEDIALPEPLARFESAHRPLLTTVGLLEPEYDLPLQIRTLASVREVHPDAGLVIVGSGSLEQELRRLIAEQPHADHILLCGDVPHEVTVRLISESDAFLRTTHYDGDSVSVHEALQLGVPVIATDNGMRPAGVHLIPVSNAPALREAVLVVLAESARKASPVPTGGQQLDALIEVYRGTLSEGADARSKKPADPRASA